MECGCRSTRWFGGPFPVLQRLLGEAESTATCASAAWRACEPRPCMNRDRIENEPDRHACGWERARSAPAGTAPVGIPWLAELGATSGLSPVPSPQHCGWRWRSPRTRRPGKAAPLSVPAPRPARWACRPGKRARTARRRTTDVSTPRVARAVLPRPGLRKLC